MTAVLNSIRYWFAHRRRMKAFRRMWLGNVRNRPGR